MLLDPTDGVIKCQCVERRMCHSGVWAGGWLAPLGYAGINRGVILSMPTAVCLHVPALKTPSV